MCLSCYRWLRLWPSSRNCFLMKSVFFGTGGNCSKWIDLESWRWRQSRRHGNADRRVLIASILKSRKISTETTPLLVGFNWWLPLHRQFYAVSNGLSFLGRGGRREGGREGGGGREFLRILGMDIDCFKWLPSIWTQSKKETTSCQT